MTIRHAHRRAVLAGAVLLWCPFGGAATTRPQTTAVIDRPAVSSALAQRSLLTAVSARGQRVVAVGERGHIVLSQDGGATWQQAASPVSVTLTCVQMVDDAQGWAAGHGGVILHTADGGRTWAKQFDGRGVVAGLARSAGSSPALQALAQQWEQEGADKPFLDLHFRDVRHGLVVGAYGMAFATEDGGQTWQSQMHRIPNPENRHLYAIAVRGETVYLAGEQGLLLRSDPQDGNFERLPSPYSGSFFNLAIAPGGTLLALGLRGHLFRSADEGRSWIRLDTGSRHSLTGSTVLPDGSVLLVDEAGTGWLSDRAVQQFRAVRFEHASAWAGVAVAGSGSGSGGEPRLVLVGVRGAVAAPLPGTKSGS